MTYTQNDDLQAKVTEAQANADIIEETAQEEDTKDAKIAELTEALARAMADMQNFKRRNEEEKGSFVKFANAELLKILIPVFDNFDRSADHLPDELKKNEWAKGVVIIHDDLMRTLEKLGIKKMPTVDEKLDPSKHEALMAGPGEQDVIIEEFEAGYTFQDETIKVAKVKVGDGTK